MNGGCKYKCALLSLAFMSVGQCTTIFPGITQSTIRKGDYVQRTLSIPFGFSKYAPESKCIKVCKAVGSFVGRSSCRIATVTSSHPVVTIAVAAGAVGTAVGYYIGRRQATQRPQTQRF